MEIKKAISTIESKDKQYDKNDNIDEKSVIAEIRAEPWLEVDLNDWMMDLTD